MIASERLDTLEVREGYENKVCEKLEVGITVGEETIVNVVFNVFKDVVTTVAAEAVGYRVCRDRVKGSAWLTDEIENCRVEEEKGLSEYVAGNVT